MQPAEQVGAVAVDAREHDTEEFFFRATELAALVAWSRGKLDRAGFRRWLRSEGWPAEDVDVLTVVIEHVFATEGRMPPRAARDTTSAELHGAQCASQGGPG